MSVISSSLVSVLSLSMLGGNMKTPMFIITSSIVDVFVFMYTGREF